VSDYAVINPATGETLRDYPTITDEELRQAIASASAAHEEWSRRVAVTDRAALVARVAALHTERREQLAETISAYAEKHDFDAFVPIAAKNGKNVQELLDECAKFLSESPWFFPEDMVTDQPERQIAAEIIREKILRTLNKEVPHGTAAVIEEFKDEKSLVSIRAEIFCEKASHKGIIVGKNGASLKLIGSYAREDLERLLGTKVYLNLWVKVKENWRESARTVENFGYRNED
jgi:GTP-binding protein Era